VTGEVVEDEPGVEDVAKAVKNRGCILFKIPG
jgi:hypothetical protein